MVSTGCVYGQEGGRVVNMLRGSESSYRINRDAQGHRGNIHTREGARTTNLSPVLVYCIMSEEKC